jgi:hypothetical protein
MNSFRKQILIICPFILLGIGILILDGRNFSHSILYLGILLYFFLIMFATLSFILGREIKIFTIILKYILYSPILIPLLILGLFCGGFMACVTLISGFHKIITRN